MVDRRSQMKKTRLVTPPQERILPVWVRLQRSSKSQPISFPISVCFSVPTEQFEDCCMDFQEYIF